MTPRLSSSVRHLHVVLLLALVVSLTGSATFAVTPARAIDFYTVNTLSDELDGNCDLPDDCSLRDALDLSITGDIINFGVTGTIDLTLGDLDVDHNVSIAGPGPEDLTIDGGGLSRIFNMGAYAISLNNMTLTGGNDSSSGGAILMNGAGVYALDNMVITNNQAGLPAGYNFGGAISMSGGTLTITNSEISNNTLVSGTGTTQGGALYAAIGTLNLTNVTFSGNHAGTGAGYGEGGAAMLGGSLTANINNSTFAGNESGYSGGGFNVHGSATAINIKNALIADNTAPNGPDCFTDSVSLTSEDYNLIESTSDCTVSGTTTHNIHGKDPVLHPLDLYEGATRSRALGAGSPAIDAGNDATCSSIDQRGYSRPQGAHCDIGAFEVQVLTVTKTADTADGTCDSDCSLREAMIAAPPASLVKFGLSGTFPLNSALPNVEKVITIDGTGQSVTLNAQDSSRIFNIWTGGDLTANQLTLSNGYDVGHGGAVFFSDGTGTFRNTTFRDNAAGDGATLSGTGGAISVVAGTLYLFNTTFANNQAVPAAGSYSTGGAIYNQDAITMVNSTFTGNSASYGGAIHNNYGDLSAISSTFSGNTGILEGGGIYNVGIFTLNLTNTILANSTSGYDCYVQFGGTLGTNPGNLIESNYSCGTPALTADPMLNPLGDHGGATETMALRGGSPAIDAGDTAACAAAPVNNLDQRGMTRPQGAACDIGAHERLAIMPPADFNGDGDTDVSVFRTGTWFVRNQGVTGWGQVADIPIAADYDGDGDSDYAVYRASTAGWRVKDQFTVAHGGVAGDVPVPGDYDFDGDADVAIYRSSTAGWYIKDQFTLGYGLSTDIPVPGDYDGNGITDIAVFRDGVWFIKDQGVIGYGQVGDIPIPGDYDGDGVTDLAVYRPSTGGWRVRNQFVVAHGGLAGDLPVPGDYNQDGITDVAIYRSSTAGWYIKEQFTVGYGLPTDYPVPARDTNGDGDPYQ